MSPTATIHAANHPAIRHMHLLRQLAATLRDTNRDSAVKRMGPGRSRSTEHDGDPSMNCSDARDAGFIDKEAPCLAL
jgi:hypothetical protein